MQPAQNEGLNYVFNIVMQNREQQKGRMEGDYFT